MCVLTLAQSRNVPQTMCLVTDCAKDAWELDAGDKFKQIELKRRMGNDMYVPGLLAPAAWDVCVFSWGGVG